MTRFDSKFKLSIFSGMYVGHSIDLQRWQARRLSTIPSVWTTQPRRRWESKQRWLKARSCDVLQLSGHEYGMDPKLTQVGERGKASANFGVLSRCRNSEFLLRYFIPIGGSQGVVLCRCPSFVLYIEARLCPLKGTGGNLRIYNSVFV